MDPTEAKRLHEAINYVGLRAQATAVGLIQLVIELSAAGLIDESAVDRIKTKIARDLALNRPPHTDREQFEVEIKLRLDQLFAGEDQLQGSATEPAFGLPF